MASVKKIKTKYPGIYYIVNKTGEKIYYARYRKNGKLIDETVGRQHLDDLTPSRAAGIRTDRMLGKVPTNAEKRQRERNKAAEWTVQRLWDEYSKTLKGGGSYSERANWNKRLKPALAKKKPADLVKLDTDRVRKAMSKKLSPQTVKHCMALLRRIINFGADQGYIPPLHFKITMPKVDNVVTEDIDPTQLTALLKVLETTKYQTVAKIMKIAMFSGMRRTEILSLQWSDIDTNRNFIYIRNPKGGKSVKIPLNSSTKAAIDTIPHKSDTWIFPSPKSNSHLKWIDRETRSIREAAGLPKSFRPLHGLRHLFATMLANSGKVDMYQLQKLLTHKSPEMTQRYAHLRDDALKRASNSIDDIFADLEKQG